MADSDGTSVSDEASMSASASAQTLASDSQQQHPAQQPPPPPRSQQTATVSRFCGWSLPKSHIVGLAVKSAMLGDTVVHRTMGFIGVSGKSVSEVLSSFVQSASVR